MEILYRHNKQSQLLVVWPTAAGSQIPLIARRNFRRDKKGIFALIGGRRTPVVRHRMPTHNSHTLTYLVAMAIAVAFPSIDF